MIRYRREELRKIFLCHEKDAIRWLPTVISSVWNLVDKIFILDHNSAPETRGWLMGLQAGYPDKVKIQTYDSLDFNEKDLRKRTWDGALDFTGYPDWVIFMDGDESLSPSLQEFLKEEFAKTPDQVPWRLLECGIQHLVGDSTGAPTFQVINFRSGTIERIWNTFSLRDFGYHTIQDLKTLQFLNLMGKPDDYKYHIAVYPRECKKRKRLTPGSSRKRILYPIDHWGYYDQGMMERKKLHYQPIDIDKDLIAQTKFIYLESAVGFDWNRISVDKFLDPEYLRPTPVGKIKWPDLMSGQDIKGFLEREFPGKPISGSWVFLGWDEGYACEEFCKILGLSLENCWLYRSPIFPLIAFVDYNRLKRRSKFQWTSPRECISSGLLQKADWVVCADPSLLVDAFSLDLISRDLGDRKFIVHTREELTVWPKSK